MQVRVRAWVGWVLCSSQVPGFMVEECAKDIKSLKEDEEGKKLLLLISKILLRSQDMKEDSEAMMKNMFHNMADKLSHEDIDWEGKSSFSFIQKDDDEEDEPEDGRDVDETVELLEDGADIEKPRNWASSIPCTTGSCRSISSLHFISPFRRWRVTRNATCICCLRMVPPATATAIVCF